MIPAARAARTPPAEVRLVAAGHQAASHGAQDVAIRCQLPLERRGRGREPVVERQVAALDQREAHLGRAFGLARPAAGPRPQDGRVDEELLHLFLEARHLRQDSIPIVRPAGGRRVPAADREPAGRAEPVQAILDARLEPGDEGIRPGRASRGALRQGLPERRIPDRRQPDQHQAEGALQPIARPAPRKARGHGPAAFEPAPLRAGPQEGIILRLHLHDHLPAQPRRRSREAHGSAGAQTPDRAVRFRVFAPTHRCVRALPQPRRLRLLRVRQGLTLPLPARGGGSFGWRHGGEGAASWNARGPGMVVLKFVQ